MKNIIVLQRDPSSLTIRERTLLKAQYGADINLIRTDPVNYREHLANCERFEAAAVLLPLDKPIPSAAMEKGFPHVTVLSNGRLARLASLKPIFMAPGPPNAA